VPQDGGGATEFVGHQQDGFIVEPAPKAIAECLDSLYSDREKARIMGERGKEKLKAMKLSWDSVVKKLINAAG